MSEIDKTSCISVKMTQDPSSMGFLQPPLWPLIHRWKLDTLYKWLGAWHLYIFGAGDNYQFNIFAEFQIHAGDI